MPRRETWLATFRRWRRGSRRCPRRARRPRRPRREGETSHARVSSSSASPLGFSRPAWPSGSVARGAPNPPARLTRAYVLTRTAGATGLLARRQAPCLRHGRARKPRHRRSTEWRWDANPGGRDRRRRSTARLVSRRDEDRLLLGPRPRRAAQLRARPERADGAGGWTGRRPLHRPRVRRDCRQLVGDGYYPAWSPEGTRIVYQSNRGATWDLWTISPEGGEPAQLTNDTDFNYHPTWSPDGDRSRTPPARRASPTCASFPRRAVRRWS